MSVTLSLLIILIALVVTILLQIGQRIKTVRDAYDDFKKTTKLNFLPKPWSPGGHDPIMGFDPYIWLKLEPMHRRYGRSFGWMAGSKKAVCTIDLDLIKKIVLDDPYLHINRPDLEVPVKELASDNIAFVKDKQWSRIRRSMAPALTAHKIKSPEIADEIDCIIDRLIEAIEKRIDQHSKDESVEVDFSDLMAHFTTEVVFSCFYGQRNEIQFDGDKKSHHIESAEINFNAMSDPIIEVAKMFPNVAPLFDFIATNFHPSGKTRRTLIEFIKKQTKLNFEARKQGLNNKSTNPNYKRSIVDTFIDNYHEGKLTRNEYLHSSFFFFFAASKTTSDGITLAAYYLAKNEEVQKKLIESIMKDGMESEYLTWCINESMRLHPPSLIGSPRALSCDLEHNGVTIPAEAMVITPVYTIHRLREYWGPDANEFRPERFRDAKDFHPIQFIPFGVGKRACPGKDFALYEIRRTLVALLIRYKFEVTERTNDTLLFRAPFGIMTIYEEPIYLRLRRREQNSS